jgi:Xaa-Pro aminopeptidase
MASSTSSVHFRMNLESYGDSYNESQVCAWARRFFAKVAWTKPVLCGKLDGVADMKFELKKLQRVLATNLKNWGAVPSKRYIRNWIAPITPWEFAQALPETAVVAKHRLERLAAILSPQATGLRALKSNAEVSLAKAALKKAEVRLEAFYQEFELFKSNPQNYNSPVAMAPMKARERALEANCLAKSRAVEAAVEREAKRQRTS